MTCSIETQSTTKLPPVRSPAVYLKLFIYNQTCGVPGRFIGYSVSFLRDGAHYASTSGSSVATLSLDREKAFDRVDFVLLPSALGRMGLGPSFIRCGVQSAVEVNGYITPFFGLSCSVRQGCPISPLLYVLYALAEVLACNIHANPAIVQLSLPGAPIPLAVIFQCADHTSVFVTSDAAIGATFASKLNLEKCKGLWLGGWSGREDPPVALQWSSARFKVLSVSIGPSGLEEPKTGGKNNCRQNCSNAWGLRKLSFLGRAVVSNALALSRIWYVASLVPMPNWVLGELDRLIFSFV